MKGRPGQIPWGVPWERDQVYEEELHCFPQAKIHAECICSQERHPRVMEQGANSLLGGPISIKTNEDALFKLLNVHLFVGGGAVLANLKQLK